MRKAFCCLRIAFVFIGSIVGAGFVSGREIVSFFVGGNIFVKCFAAALLFAFFSIIIITAGKNFSDAKALQNRLFGRLSSAFDIFFAISIAVMLSSMLAGLDSLNQLVTGINAKIPVLSLPTIIVCFAISVHGENALKRVSSLLVPIIVISIIVLLSVKGGFSSTYDGEKVSGGMVVLYAAMNVFMSVPVILTLSKEDYRSTAIALAFSGVVLGVLIGFILSAINYEGASAVAADMPLVYIFSTNRPTFFVLVFAAFFAIITTILSHIYSFRSVLGKDRNTNKTTAFALFCCFLLSRLGIKIIISIFYPCLGILGLLYVLLCAKSLLFSKTHKK